MKNLRIFCLIAVVLLISHSSADTRFGFQDDGNAPESGCLIGAYLGCGPGESCVSIDDFHIQTGKNHSLFVRFMDIGTSRDGQHMEWARDVTDHGAAPVFIYDPWSGLDQIDNGDVRYFAGQCSQLPSTVFIVFGHEMNGDWYPWGNRSETFIEKFREVAEIFHETAPNVAMCWVPNQNWACPRGENEYGDGYSEFYPEGSGQYGEYVDWVGLNFYEKDWDEDDRVPPDMFVANIRKGNKSMDFYEVFAVGRDKPMMIAETGAFDPNNDWTAAGVRVPLTGPEQDAFKNDWIAQVYNASLLETEFPRLHAICYLHVLKNEQIKTNTHLFYNIPVDYRIPAGGSYQQLVADDYFLPGSIRGDLNGNGNLDWGDVVKCAYMSWGKITPDVAAADFNGNGIVDWGDVVKLAYTYWGLIPPA